MVSHVRHHSGLLCQQPCCNQDWGPRCWLLLVSGQGVSGGMTVLLELAGIHISPPTLHPRLKQLRASLPALSPPWSSGDSSQLVESVAGPDILLRGPGLVPTRSIEVPPKRIRLPESC